jgi:cell division protein FtsA
VDGKTVYGKTVGMVGTTIEAKTFFITSPAEHLSNLMTTARLADIDTIEDVSSSSIASSIALLTKSQRIAGCGLLTIGAETSSFVVFEDDAPVSIIVFSLGSKDVTHDIALGFKVSLEEAERIKISRPESVPYPRKKIEEVVRARLEDIFDLVQTHLKKIGKAGLLPAGVLITGGGAQNPYVEDIAKDILKLPAKKVGIKFDGESKISIPNAIWSCSYGLSMISMSVAGNTATGIRFPGIKRGLFRNIKKFFEKLMP